ncbi:MAG: hypothetical protein H0W08_14675 [Acidobacteria bacterium]|nr:hypothetical protein [Acidobacteriota bacterium]
MNFQLMAVLLMVAMTRTEAPQEKSAIDEAKALFARYVEMEQAYDPALADLYSNDAVITNKRTYPTGEVRELTFPAPKYKALIRQAMPLARSRSDRSTYSKCSYEPEGVHVRIQCARYSELKKFTSPLTLVIGRIKTAGWLILEERSESRP